MCLDKQIDKLVKDIEKLQVYDNVYIYKHFKKNINLLYKINSKLEKHMVKYITKFPRKCKKPTVFLSIIHEDNEDSLLFMQDFTNNWLYFEYINLIIHDETEYSFSNEALNIYNIVNAKKDVIKDANIAVFDLDDTIIDKDGKIIINDLHSELTTLRSYFDFIILWSHGNDCHVRYHTNKIKFKFDLVLCRDEIVKYKGTGKVFKELFYKYGVVSLKNTLLVDDLSENSAEDYDYIIIADKSDSSILKAWSEIKSQKN